jgi:diguanylate cyclase (GGDEF)-like protein
MGMVMEKIVLTSIFNWSITVIFLIFSLVHLFLDQSYIGPIGLLAFGAANFSLEIIRKSFKMSHQVSIHGSMALLISAVFWYMSGTENLMSPALFVIMVLPGVIYFLLGFKAGIFWALTIFALNTSFSMSNGFPWMANNFMMPTLNPELVVVDFWIVFSVMLFFSFFISHLFVKQHKKIMHLMQYDQMTDIYNRHGLKEKVEQIYKLSQRYNINFCVILFDVDHFKKVNDNYGHDCGDRVLKGIVNTTKSRLRDTDLFGRWGGEEFLIVLPHTDINQALIVSEKVRAAVEELEFVSDDNVPFKTSISLGISMFLNIKEEFSTIVKNADLALYEAKDGGRNQTAIFEDKKSA